MHAVEGVRIAQQSRGVLVLEREGVNLVRELLEVER